MYVFYNVFKFIFICFNIYIKIRAKTTIIWIKGANNKIF
jgi:hypothetical protein